MKDIMFTAAIVFGLLVCGIARAQPVPKEISRALGTAHLQGQAASRLWGFKLYDAQLWTGSNGAFDQNQKFALSLRYAYDFSADLLARTSIKEIVRVEGGNVKDHKALEDQLRACLVDVSDGVRVTGVSESASRASMYVNGQKTCTFSYPRLRDRFFGIWLAPTSRDTRAASKLRGHS
nr:hypothetical protein [Amylibacter sp.]